MNKARIIMRALAMMLLGALLAFCLYGDTLPTNDWLCQHVSVLFCPGAYQLQPITPPRVTPIPVKRTHKPIRPINRQIDNKSR